MNTLEYCLNKFNLSYDDRTRMPLEIRDFDRDSMAELFGELGFTFGAEIGVRDGGYSLQLMTVIPDLTLYGIDPYEPHAGYRDHVYQTTFDSFEKQAHEKLDSFVGYKFIKAYSSEALESFMDNSLDFVYIDGDHSFYEVVHDIDKWTHKVRRGGIVSGDDYFKSKGPSKMHVPQALHGYTDAYNIRPWFAIGTKAIVEGEKRDKGRSWMFIK